jgi:hypothetical protein
LSTTRYIYRYTACACCRGRRAPAARGRDQALPRAVRRRRARGYQYVYTALQLSMLLLLQLQLQLLLCCFTRAATVADASTRSAGAASLPPIEPRVQALLSKMTPEAKVAQLMIGRGPKPGTGNWPDGFGCTPGMSYAGDDAGRALSHTEQAAANDALQKWALENTTYGIPLTFYAETLHTAQNGATVFPAPAGLGATWNVPLVRKAAETIGYEARLKGIDRAWSPELQVATDPRFGRFDESFAEDPHFVANVGVAFADGLQGGAVGGPDTYGNFSAMLVSQTPFAQT